MHNEVAFHLKRAVLFVLAATLLWLILGLVAHAQPVAPVTSDEWTRLVIELQLRQHKLDNDDRVFLFRMLNILTSRTDVVPDAPQRKWLLDIERRLNAGR